MPEVSNRHRENGGQKSTGDTWQHSEENYSEIVSFLPVFFFSAKVLGLGQSTQRPERREGGV